MKKILTLLANPFERIAGIKALLWGLLSIIIGSVVSYFTGWHYHGMLHFGPALNNEAWCYVAERLTVWLLPATVFLIGGLILSKSKIRLIDVYGTTAFAQIPLFIGTLSSLIFDVETVGTAKVVNIVELALFSLFIIIFVVFNIVWMYNAFKVSCNVKGVALRLFFIAAFIGCDILSRYVISFYYTL